jgi:hypothetical protein
MAKTETAVAVKEEAGALAVIDFGTDAGHGFEDADSSAYAIPFLRQLQMMSGACKKTDPAYVKGAEEGDFINTVTGKLYKGDEGVLVIPVEYKQKYNLWAPDRGGFRGSLNKVEYANLVKTKDDKGFEIDDEDNTISDTREHYLMVINPDGTLDPALLALSGTQLKRSKNWMTLMNGVCLGGKKPMFSQIYKLTSQGESNDKGSWAGVKVEHVQQITDIEQYNAAKEFYNMVRSGEAKATPIDEEIPF